VNLDTDFICDRFTESNVFEEANMDPDLVLLGASHLSKIRKHLNEEQWNVLDLTKPGWRISADIVKTMLAEVTVTAASVNWDTTTVILQLFDNSVYMVGGQGGEKTLPKRDHDGTYHIDGHLVVADKAAVKSLMGLLMPLLKLLGNSRKLFLTPLGQVLGRTVLRQRRSSHQLSVTGISATPWRRDTCPPGQHPGWTLH
jgi:hypothetical protein